MFILTHANGDIAEFIDLGDNVLVTEIIGGEIDPEVRLPKEVARGLWKAFVAQGFRRDRDAEGDGWEEHWMASRCYKHEEDDDYKSEQYAETYNDARMFGYDHADAAFCASQHVRGEAY